VTAAKMDETTMFFVVVEKRRSKGIPYLILLRSASTWEK
jgi:hypothetical protein